MKLQGSGAWRRRRQWHPTPVLLPGESHGRRSRWAAVHGVPKSWTQLSDFTFTFHFHAWRRRRKWQPTPVFLPGESQGLGSLVGCHLWGSHRVGHDWSDLAATVAGAWRNAAALWPFSAIATFKVCLWLSRVWFFATLWTVACQAPVSMEFLRQEYWSGYPFYSPGDLPDPGIKPRSLTLHCLPSNYQGSPEKVCWWTFNIHKAFGNVSKIHLPSRNVLGMVIAKKSNTLKKFKKPISRDTFHSHPFRKSHEKMSASLNIRDMQTKTTPWYHDTLVKMAIGKNPTKDKCWRRVEKKEPSYTDARSVNCEQLLWRTEWSFLRQWNGQWN